MKIEKLKDEELIEAFADDADPNVYDYGELVAIGRELAKRLQAKNAALGELRPVIQNARMVRAIAESYAELDPKWAKSTLDYFHGVVTEPLERAAELSTVEGGKP